MERTFENCSLIKTNVEAGRGKPVFHEGLCEGYIHRSKIHRTCYHCDLYVNRYKNKERE